jgi:hypothetical protein
VAEVMSPFVKVFAPRGMSDLSPEYDTKQRTWRFLVRDVCYAKVEPDTTGRSDDVGL